MGRKLLLAGDGNFLGHMGRLLEVGLALRDSNGYEVVYAGEGPFIDLVRAAAFPVLALYTPDREGTLAFAERADFGRRWLRDSVERCVRADLACLETVAPDLVVGDMRWSLHTSAELAGLPYVSITNAAWTSYSAAPPRALDDHFSTRFLGRRLAELLLPSLKRVLCHYWAAEYRRVRRRWGLDPARASSLLKVVEGADLILLVDLPEFAPAHELPANAHYVGPILWRGAWENGHPPSWLDALDPDRPSVYVTMGSTGKTEYFRRAIEVFGDTDYQLVMTTGKQVPPGWDLPANVHMVDYAPGLEIMKRCDLVINHGGSGTLYQAIAAGKPVVGIPFHLEQEVNLQRVEQLGFGVKLRQRTCTNEVLRRAVEVVLADPRYRGAAAALQATLCQYEGAAVAANLIDRLASARARRP